MTSNVIPMALANASANGHNGEPDKPNWNKTKKQLLNLFGWHRTTSTDTRKLKESIRKLENSRYEDVKKRDYIKKKKKKYIIFYIRLSFIHNRSLKNCRSVSTNYYVPSSSTIIVKNVNENRITRVCSTAPCSERQMSMPIEPIEPRRRIYFSVLEKQSIDSLETGVLTFTNKRDREHLSPTTTSNLQWSTCRYFTFTAVDYFFFFLTFYSTTVNWCETKKLTPPVLRSWV